MKLSARAVNNLVIFAMLVMIMLFNMDKWLPKPVDQQQARLIAEQDMLLRIDIGAHSLERIGTDWRIVGTDKRATAASAFVSNWHDARLAVVGELPDYTHATVADVWLAGYAEPITIELYASRTANDQRAAWVRIADQVYRVDNVGYDALVF